MPKLGKRERAKRQAIRDAQRQANANWIAPEAIVATPIDPRQPIAKLGQVPCAVIRTKTGRLEIVRGLQSSIYSQTNLKGASHTIGFRAPQQRLNANDTKRDSGARETPIGNRGANLRAKTDTAKPSPDAVKGALRQAR